MQFEHQFNVCNESLYIKYDKYDLTIARLNDKEKTKQNEPKRSEKSIKIGFRSIFRFVFRFVWLITLENGPKKGLV